MSNVSHFIPAFVQEKEDIQMAEKQQIPYKYFKHDMQINF